MFIFKRKKKVFTKLEPMEFPKHLTQPRDAKGRFIKEKA